MKRAIMLCAVLSGAALTNIQISPTGHHYEAIVNGQSGWAFKVTMPPSTDTTNRLSAKITGLQPDHFAVDLSPSGGLPGSGQSTCVTWRTGSCTYVVVYRPKSAGQSRADLIVSDARGNSVRATLTGLGVDTCRPVQVMCNFLDLYEGVISSRTALATAAQNPTGRTGRWITETTVTISKGQVWCQVGRDDAEEDNGGGVRRSRSSESGTIVGEGLAAIEFRRLQGGGGYEYTVKFSCPSPATTGTSIDYMSNTSSTSASPATPLKWDSGIAIGPHPVKAIGVTLEGKQIDPYENVGSNDGVEGGTTTTWSLKRWQ